MKIALVCIAKDEDQYIDEWINYHLKLGFDHIIIYANDWVYNTTNNNVSIIPMNGPVAQLQSYNHFIRNNINKYDWAAFIDIDEFIVLKNHNNIHDFVGQFNGVMSIAINWALFGDNNHTEIVNNNYSVLERFTKRQSSPDKHIKVISRINRNVLFNTTPHRTNQTWVDSKGSKGMGPFNHNGSLEDVQINHYFRKTRQEFKSKMEKGRADTNNPQHRRTMLDFDNHNFNEVEDTLLWNFS